MSHDLARRSVRERLRNAEMDLKMTRAERDQRFTVSEIEEAFWQTHVFPLESHAANLAAKKWAELREALLARRAP